MTDYLYNLTWPQAKALLEAGTPVRLLTDDYWLVYNRHTVQKNIDGSGENEGIVTANDFTEAHLTATNYTTAPIEETDECVGLVPPQLPRDFRFRATATCADGLTAFVEIPDIAIGDAWKVEIRHGLDQLGSAILNSGEKGARFALSWPLAAAVDDQYELTAVFTNTGAFTGMTQRLRTIVDWPIAPFTYNTGTPPSSGAGTSFPIAIPFSTARDWYQKREWKIDVRLIQAEAYTGASATGDDRKSVGWMPWSNCSRGGSITFNIPRAVTYSTSGLVTFSESLTVKIDLVAGYRDGNNFWPRIEITFPVYTSLSASGTGYGTPTASVLGRNIPMVSTWSPGWSGNPGYVNSSTFSVIVK